MNRFLLAGLFLSSFIWLSSCSPLKGYRKEKVLSSATGVIKSVIPQNAAQLYRAEIDLLNRHFSGLLVIKKTTDTTTHLTFLTELGMTIFDFRITDYQMELVAILEALNKPAVVNLLKEDLSRMMLLPLFRSESAYYRKGEDVAIRQKNKYRNYYLAGNDSRIDEIIIKGKLLRKAKIHYTYFDAQDHPSEMKLKRAGAINLRIKFNSIGKE